MFSLNLSKVKKVEIVIIKLKIDAWIIYANQETPKILNKIDWINAIKTPVIVQ